MGRLDVRTATQTAVQNANLPYVGTVFPARPVIAQEDAYTTTMNGTATSESVNGSACLIVVNITDDDRIRYGDVGRAALADFDKHLVVLELWFACTAGDGTAAQQDYDTVVDNLVEFIRENPTMGAPAAVWSAGEYRYGVKHSQGSPYTSEDGLTVLINGLVKFEAWEQVSGSSPIAAD